MITALFSPAIVPASREQLISMHQQLNKFIFAILLFASAAQAQNDLFVAGTTQRYWIAAPLAPDAAAQTLVQMRDIGGDGHWRAIGRLGSPIADLANHDSQVGALLRDGNWLTLWDGGSASGPLPEDGSTLRNLASVGSDWWAICAAGEIKSPSTRSTSQPTTQAFPAGTLLLEKLSQGHWQRVASLPASAAQARLLSLGEIDAMPALVELFSDGAIRAFTWKASSKSWKSCGEFQAGFTPMRIALLNEPRGAIWIGGANSPGEIFRPGQRDATELKAPAGWSATSAIDATIAGGNVRVVAISGGKLTEYAFASDGTPRGSSPLDQPMADSEGQKPLQWYEITFASLAVLMLLTAVRRRGEVPAEMLAAAGIELAPLWLRFIAGMIDAIPMLIAYGIIGAHRDQLDAAMSSESMPVGVMAPFYIGTAIYLLHTLLCEMLLGWTIGKKICGLQICNIDGSPPMARAILIRNLLRIIDVMMIVPLALVIFSPLRQRVGDIAADTIVVRKID